MTLSLSGSMWRQLNWSTTAPVSVLVSLEEKPPELLLRPSSLEASLIRFCFCFSLSNFHQTFSPLLQSFFFVLAHTEFNNLSPLRMAACAAGTTSCGSGTPTCLVWAANKWPRSSGSVATGWSWWSPGVPWMKVPPSLPSCLWCCPLSANNRWGQQFKIEQVQLIQQEKMYITYYPEDIRRDVKSCMQI